MSTSLRLPLGALLLAAAAACSSAPDKPALSADLEQDLARAGGAKVELAGSAANRVDVVSAAERVESSTPAPAKTVARAASAKRSTRAVAPSPRRSQPAASTPTVRSPEPAPVERPRVETAPDPVPQSRPAAPAPRQQEPPGGWRTPSEVIRNAPFPINP
ncbi:MAG TPA: hypothetical protein VFP90_07885 [Gemmatimonadaceae bacterium]|nr:hypothetical protein [Gemmatimonadaceae bacterium]